MPLRLSLFISVICFLSMPTYAQDCNNPNGTRGDVMFNNTHDAFQGCTARGWMAFHEPAAPPDPCTISSTVGDVCADGQTVYAGSWNGSRYYTTTADQSVSAYYGTFGVALGVNARSMSDGLTNTNTALARINANPSATCSGERNPPGCSPNAHKLCEGLRSTLDGNWYLPALNELLSVLYENKHDIGGFSNDYYWSSTEIDGNLARFVRFSDGFVNQTIKGDPYRVRCVRRE